MEVSSVAEPLCENNSPAANKWLLLPKPIAGSGCA
jgi:hypothetical protein